MKNTWFTPPLPPHKHTPFLYIGAQCRACSVIQSMLCHTGPSIHKREAGFPFIAHTTHIYNAPHLQQPIPWPTPYLYLFEIITNKQSMLFFAVIYIF